MSRVGKAVLRNAKGKPKKYDQLAGSVCVSDSEGNEIYSALIYRERGSFRENEHAKNGFKWNSLDGPEAQPLAKVQEELRRIFDGKLIIGCDMRGDFEALEMEMGEYSKNCFDLQWYYKHESGEKMGLQNMCKRYLQENVQTGDFHTAAEDAISTVKMFRHYMTINPPPIRQLKDAIQ